MNPTTVTRLHPLTNRTGTPREKFGAVGRLYSHIGVENGVVTDDGPGTLMQAFDDTCLVLLMRQKATGRTASGTPYRPMKQYPTDKVRVA